MECRQINSLVFDNVFGIVSYNLYGLNNVRIMLENLCNDRDIQIIAVQECWLSPLNMGILNNVHTHFVGLGISPMRSGYITSCIMAIRTVKLAFMAQVDCEVRTFCCSRRRRKMLSYVS
jgi:hypothetical protein